MKKYFQIAAWVIIIGGIIVGDQVCTRNKAKLESIKQVNEIEKLKATEQAKTETTRTKTETTRKAIIELADKHNAAIDWNKPSNELPLPIFTIEVEDILLRKDNRPVLLLVTANDIERKGNKYSVWFVNNSEDKLTEVKFILDCSDEQVRKIMQQQSDSRLLEKYAVVAVINKVKKITFGVNTEVTGENEEEEEEDNPSGEIVIDMPFKFVATGHCVDLLFVGYYGYDWYHEDKKE